MKQHNDNRMQHDPRAESDCKVCFFYILTCILFYNNLFCFCFFIDVTVPGPVSRGKCMKLMEGMYNRKTKNKVPDTYLFFFFLLQIITNWQARLLNKTILILIQTTVHMYMILE